MSKQDYFRSLTSKKVLLLGKKDLKSEEKYLFWIYKSSSLSLAVVFGSRFLVQFKLNIFGLVLLKLLLRNNFFGVLFWCYMSVIHLALCISALRVLSDLL